MTYRHITHAGNVADVFKHLILVHWLLLLRRGTQAFCYYETHAGAGRYDLGSDAAQASGEHRRGIGRLWRNLSASTSVPQPPGVAAYLNAVTAINPEVTLGHTDTIRFYPGSPRIARSLLRDQDRMVLFERDSDAFSQLQREFSGDQHVMLQHSNGLIGLTARPPLAQRHGFVFIDPPYVTDGEIDEVAVTIKRACAQWPRVGLAIWYPISHEITEGHRPYDDCFPADANKWLRAEMRFAPDDATETLRGCGLALIHPPAELEPVLREALGYWRLVSTSRNLGDFILASNKKMTGSRQPA